MDLFFFQVPADETLLELYSRTTRIIASSFNADPPLHALETVQPGW